MLVYTRNTARILLIALALACSWCACIAAGAPQPATQSYTITIAGFKYQPDVLTVHVGDTVEWKNNDIVPHTVTAVDKSFSSGSIAPGATWRFVAKKAGVFLYGCTPHPNMHGKLIVQ